MTVGAILAVARRLAELDDGVDDEALVERLGALEALKAAASAAQARAAAALDASQRQQQRLTGVPAAERGRGVAAQVALARRESAHRGGRLLGLAKALVHEMPGTFRALQAGRISEWRATVLARETAVLSREDRAAVDEELAGSAEALARLEGMGDREVAAAAKRIAYRLDPRSVVARARRAEGERCVTIRPAPDTMAYVTALLPVQQAVSVHAALQRAADAARGRPGGDERSRGQLMADALVERVLAGAAAAPGTPRVPDVAVRLVVTDRTLLAGGDEPAALEGHGPVPAGWARELVAGTVEAGARVALQKVLLDDLGRLVAMESRGRFATPGLAAAVRLRDGGTCRTPWCDAPVRHVDHVERHAEGGRTRLQDLQGLCEACNQAKEAAGWRSRVDEATGTVVIRTPSGVEYRSVPPPLPGAPPTTAEGSPIEAHLALVVGLAA